MNSKMAELVRRRFSEQFGNAEPTVALAPGRVNLIGEHTDYNDGYVLPMGIDRHVIVAFAPRDDRVWRAHSVDFGATKEAGLDDLQPVTTPGWFDYVVGVVWAMSEEGQQVSGADLVVGGDVPIGAGLSSSAALELAVARALCHLSRIEWDPKRMALTGQRAENEYVGVRCGIMDQLAAAVSPSGSALLLDCRSLETAPVPLPDSLSVVVMDTGIRRSLAAGAYNDRRRSCEVAVAAVREHYPGVNALRDVDRAHLAKMEHLMDPVTYNRAKHVVAEIERPPAFAEAIVAGDPVTAGELMNASHESLRDLYEVSSEELDLVTSLAREQVGCYGARMSGAGFGGCAVALVASERAETFMEDVCSRYGAATDGLGDFFVSRPVAGARLV